MVCDPRCSGSAGRGRDAVPGDCRRKAGCMKKGKEKPPLCKGGTDCQRQSGGIVKLDKPTQLGSIIQRGSAVWPSGPPDRRSPTAPFAQGSRLCCSAYNQPPRVDNKKLPRWGSFLLFTWFYDPARERSLAAAARRSPPCAKGGQHGRAMQGGLQSQANDSAGCCDRVREHRLAVPTRDRQHRLDAAARRQSLSRRSPTAPFAQGRSGGRTAILFLPDCTEPASSVALGQDCKAAPAG